MSVDFLSVFDSSNSIINEETGEITITAPIIEIDGKFKINDSCKITSNCNTVISSKKFKILCSSVSLSNISFKTAILIRDVENVSIQNCTVKESKLLDGAITISGSQNIFLSNIDITDTDNFPGIYVKSNSIVLGEKLTIHDITDTLLVCYGSSFLTIKDSSFHHSGGNAFYVYDQSYIEILNSNFSYTEYPSLFITNSQCTLKDNSFRDIDKNSISIDSSKDFIVQNNTIENIKDTAIRIGKQSVGIVQGNKIYKIDGNGINCNDSDIQIIDNEMSEISYPAIAIVANSSGAIESNQVSNVGYSGIVSRNSKNVTIKSNRIANIKESGISISDTLTATIENNEITDCNISAIEGYNWSLLHVKNNTISRIKKFAFDCFTSGVLNAENNRIDGVSIAMARVIYKGGGVFVNNDVSNCPIQCNCKTSADYFFNGNGQFNGETNIKSKVTASIRYADPYVVNDVLCLKCNKKRRNYYLVDCGHKVYCKECAELALSNKESCPICRFPIVKVLKGFKTNNGDDNAESDLCIICFEKKADTIILPCGHMGVCSTCLENWFHNKKVCPICRTESSFFKKMTTDIC